MTNRFALAFLLVPELSTCLAAQQPTRSPDALLAGIRKGVVRMLSEVQDYACRETIERSRLNRGSKKWVRVDTFALDVAHIDGSDLYAVSGSGFSRTPPAPGRGAFARGDFAGHLKTLFTGKDAKITFHGREPLGGTQALRYDFVIPPAGADWVLRDDARSAAVGAKGSFWADAKSLDLLRLEIQAEHIPRELAFRSAKQRIDYARMRIGTAVALLPQSAELNTVVLEDLWPHWSRNELTRTEQRNLIEFSHCRQYQAQSSVSFEAETFDLVPGVSLTVRLRGPIDLALAAAGDPVSAVLENPVVGAHKAMIPAGATLSGRIRSLEKSPSEFTVTFEFLELISGDRHAMFFGNIETAAAGGADVQLTNERTLPGLVMFRVPARTPALEDLRMIWRIGSAPEAPNH